MQPDKRYQTAAQLALDLQQPDQIVLTRRSERMARSSQWTRLKRWFFALGAEPAEAVAPSATEVLNRSNIIMAAVDVDNASPELLDQLRETVRRIVLTEPGARLACVSVMRLSPLATASPAANSLSRLRARATSIRRRICGELVKATRSILPSAMRRMTISTLSASAAEA